MPLVKCPECNKEVSDQATACVNCGHPMRPAATTPASPAGESVPVGGPIVALIGGALLAVGPFLAWATLGRLSATGIEKVGSEAYLLVVMGLAGLALPVEALVQKKPMRTWGPLVMGLLGGLLTGFYMMQIYEQLQKINVGNPAIGIGAYISLVGAIMLIVGALAKPPKTSTEKNQ